MKKNFIYSLILTIISYVSSLIVFPYVSRVLGASGLGHIEYVNQMSAYFQLFAFLGVMSIGTREIAACADDCKKRSYVFSSIFSLSLFCTIITLLVYFICVFSIPSFRDEKNLFLIASANILFTTLQVEWLYRGLENFKYITIRSVVIRVVYIIMVFLFVKDSDDYIMFFLLTVLIVVVNAIINISYSRKFVKYIFSFEVIKNGLKKFVKPFVTLGANSIMNSFYSTFTVVYLGIVCSKEAVGYYYVSNKIMSICIGVITAFTMVMLPKMSKLIGTNDKSEYNRLLDKSFKIAIDFSIPFCVCLFLFASEIVFVLSGNGFSESVLPLKIIAPVIIINALNQIMVFQVQMPNKKDNAVFVASMIGAIIGVVFNLVLVKQWGVVGSATVLLFSTLSGLIYNIWYCLHNELMMFPWKYLFTIVLLSIPYIVIYYLTSMLTDNIIVKLMVGVVICVLYWLLFNYRKYMPMVFIKKNNH